MRQKAGATILIAAGAAGPVLIQSAFGAASAVPLYANPAIYLLSGSVLFGMLLVALGYDTIRGNPEMHARLYQVVRMMIAFGAGFIAAGVTGGIEISGEWGPLTVKAGGPMACVLLFYKFDP